MEPAGRRPHFDDITRLAAAFVLTVDSGARGDIWAPAARELIANLLLAAHHAGLTLLDAYAWLMDETAKMPVQLLRRHGSTPRPTSLAGTQATQRTDPRQRVLDGADRVVVPAGSGDRPVGDPPRRAARFDPQRFVASRQTLYLLSKDASRRARTAGPLVAALTDRVRLCAERLGERPGGRMDPPLLLVLDEAANIARIDDLPALYSHLGTAPSSRHHPAVLRAGRGGVGQGGMKALWGAATVKLFGPGADDAGWAEEMSRLIGEHDVDVLSYSSGRHGHSRSAATRRERIIPPDALRAMRKGTAVLLATGVRPAA